MLYKKEGQIWVKLLSHTKHCDKSISQDTMAKKLDDTSLTLRVISSVIAGGLGGCIATSLVYPLDFARTRMALSNARRGRDGGSVRKTLMKTWHRDGFRGFYRGYFFSIMGVFLYRSTYFGLYDTAKLLTPVGNRNLYTSFLEAEMAATTFGLLSYGFDMVRRTMMMQDKHSKSNYVTSWDCIKAIYKKKGARGFYHGAGVNVVRGSGGAIMLVLYDELQEVFWKRPMYENIPDKHYSSHRGHQGHPHDSSYKSEQQCNLYRSSNGLCDF